MGQHDHAVRLGERLRDAGALEMLQMDRDRHGFLAVRAVGDDRRDAGEPVFACQGQVFLAGEPLPAVQHAGLHEMTRRAPLRDEIDDPVVQVRFQVRSVALLPEMDLQRYVGREVAPGALQQSFEEADGGPGETGVSGGGIERDEENVGHGVGQQEKSGFEG